MRRVPLVGLLVGLLVATAVGRAPAEEEEWERPFAGLLPPPSEAGPTDYVATRIVDAATRRPVAGARLRHFPERVAGNVTEYAPLISQALADEQGFAWVPTPNEEVGGHWIADAPGFAAHQEFGTPGEEISLRRGADATARLLGPFGQPLAGVRVETYLGCPHGPALEVVTTAADGTFTLHGFDPEATHMWVVAPGCASDLALDAADLLTRGARRADVTLQAAATVRGRVLDAAGKPLPDVVLRADEMVRGPTARTGSDGRFALEGVLPGARLHAFHPKAPSRLSPDASAWIAPSVEDPDPAATLTIPLSEEGLLWNEEPDATVAVRGETDAEAGAIPTFRVRLTRSDGRSYLVPVQGVTDVPVSIDVPFGTYAVAAASTFEPVDVTPATVSAGPRATTEVVVKVVLRPRLAVVGDVPEGMWMYLAVAGEEIVVGGDGGADPADLRLAAGVPAVLRVWDSFFEVGPAKDGVRTVTVRLPPRHVVRVNGRPNLRGAYLTRPPWTTWLDTFDREGRIETYAAGDLLLHEGDDVWRVSLPVDRAVEVVVDPAKDAALTPPSFEASVRFVRADGSSPKAVVTVQELPDTDDGSFVVSGATSPVDVTGPCRVRVEAEGLATLDADVTTPGVTTLTWGTCMLVVEVRDLANAKADGVVLVDDRLYAVGNGRLSLAGLRPGPHRVVVSPLTARLAGVEFRVVLKDGETRTKRVQFSAR